jgi:hypothetical protein
LRLGRSGGERRSWSDRGRGRSTFRGQSRTARRKRVTEEIARVGGLVDLEEEMTRWVERFLYILFLANFAEIVIGTDGTLVANPENSLVARVAVRVVPGFWLVLWFLRKGLWQRLRTVLAPLWGLDALVD